jgi:hypothetical protein
MYLGVEPGAGAMTRLTKEFQKKTRFSLAYRPPTATSVRV